MASASDQSLNISRSDSGTPSISAMIRTGSAYDAVGHQVDLAFLESVVDERHGELADAVPERVDDPRGERLLHESAQSRVVRRVAEEERRQARRRLRPPDPPDRQSRQALRWRPGSTLRVSLLERLSRRIARQSECLVKTQKPSGLRCTGLTRVALRRARRVVVEPLIERVEEKLAVGDRPPGSD